MELNPVTKGIKLIRGGDTSDPTLHQPIQHKWSEFNMEVKILNKWPGNALEFMRITGVSGYTKRMFSLIYMLYKASVK